MRTLFRLVLALSTSCLLFGCGGSNSAPQVGTFEIKVLWPADRLLPVDSLSVVATLSDSKGNVLGTQLLARPTSGSTITTADFDNVPVGKVMLAASAYPTAQGTGVAQAVGSAPGTVSAGQKTTIDVTMADTIVKVTITPANPTVAVQGQLQLTMTAYDAENDVVLTSPNTTSWSPPPGSDEVATVDSTGLMTGIGAGSGQVSVTETESGVSGTTSVTVTSGNGGLIGTIQ